MQKYRNKKSGKYHSGREHNRAWELQMLQRAGKISDLQEQVKFVLIPTQREPATVGPRGGLKLGKVIEHECSYFADFVYTDTATGKKVVEDSKGFRTKDYIIKRKLMLQVHGIRIYET